jgi:hypothetical protein
MKKSPMLPVFAFLLMVLINVAHGQDGHPLFTGAANIIGGGMVVAGTALGPAGVPLVAGGLGVTALGAPGVITGVGGNPPLPLNVPQPISSQPWNLPLLQPNGGQSGDGSIVSTDPATNPVVSACPVPMDTVSAQDLALRIRARAGKRARAKLDVPMRTSGGGGGGSDMCSSASSGSNDDLGSWASGSGDDDRQVSKRIVARVPVHAAAAPDEFENQMNMVNGMLGGSIMTRRRGR